MKSIWYAPLEGLASLGSRHAGPGSLAGLHAARSEHLSQFFTTREIAEFMWRIVRPTIDEAYRRDGHQVALLDNSVGSARLLQFADPQFHTLAGVDVHAPSVEAVTKTAQAAGFVTDFVVAGMEEVRPRGFGVALINPPFSIHLESPHMEPLECCSFGRFGPGTSCLSHVYAVGQALEAADIVVAVLPLTFASTLATDPFFSPRLRYIARLPGDAFKEEGANVATAVAVWGDIEWGDGVISTAITDLATAEIPDLKMRCRTTYGRPPKPLSRGEVDASEPSILTPVTGNTKVRVCRHNRRVLLKFACGLTEAKVLNAIYRERVNGYTEEHRYPTSVRYRGQGLLDLEIHLAQPDPVGSFRDFEELIRTSGGAPEVDPGIYGYLRRMARKLERHRVPFAHTIRATGAATAGNTAELVAKSSFMLDPKKWGGPSVKKGTTCNGRRTTDGRWIVEAAGAEWPMSDEELTKRFEVKTAAAELAPEWLEKFPGRLKTFPALAHQARTKARALGLEKFLSWGYQFEDACEIAISPFNAVLGAEMGLGKSRIAVGLFLLNGSKHNLYCTEAHLVPEVVSELVKIGIAPGDWQIIDTEDSLKELRLINVISYHRLRMPVRRGGNRKLTYAKRLRRRIGCVVADEGHCLRNLQSDQTRAMWTLAARRRYIFTGTMVANYPRDTLNMLAWVGGSGTAVQPFGIRSQLYLEPRLITSMSKAQRGVDAYCEAHVTLEWVTHEWREDMDKGAKREVPKISNLAAFRQWLAPWVKRRLAHEPEVARYITIPVPTEKVTVVDWDDDHLAYYLRVSDQFAAWYREARKKADQAGNNLNLISLLARIGAVETACNNPQAGVDGFGCLGGLTSKQEYVLDRVEELVETGQKIIVYAKSPQLLELLALHLGRRKVDTVLLHGGRDIVERTKDLNERFRNGSTPVLLASFGVTQTGLNLHQASYVIFLNRDWSAKTERQAKARVLRPQQEKPVTVEYIHLPGSIDEYQAQMVRFKGVAADAGLDWATPETDNEQFAHLDHIIGNFIADCAARHGLDPHAFRDKLKVRRAA